MCQVQALTRLARSNSRQIRQITALLKPDASCQSRRLPRQWQQCARLTTLSKTSRMRPKRLCWRTCSTHALKCRTKDLLVKIHHPSYPLIGLKPSPVFPLTLLLHLRIRQWLWQRFRIRDVTSRRTIPKAVSRGLLARVKLIISLRSRKLTIPTLDLAHMTHQSISFIWLETRTGL